MQKESCILIVPHFTSGKGSILGSFNYTMPPLGLLSIASWLRYNEINSHILDFTIEDRKRNIHEIIISSINKTGVPEWFGITVCTPVAYNAYDISDFLKQQYPDTKIVLGGPHITVLKERVFLECNSADFLITGEGEYTLCNLIKNNDLTPDNLFERNNIVPLVKQKAEIVDLDKLPMPAYDLIDFNKYIPPPASLNSRYPGIGIITSRGCPYQCTFCTKITGSNLRFYPVEKIIDQIKYLKKTYNIKQFHFYDDTITCRKKNIVELCQEIIRENLDLHWSCFSRVDTVDEEILLLMKKAGCFVIMYGVESMDDYILKTIKKGITVEQIYRAFELTRKAGIETRAAIIIGTREETRETLNKTKKSLLKLHADFLQIFIAIPMPGSQFYIDAKKEDRLLSENWEYFNLSKVLYKHPLFTEKELFKAQRKIYLSFYLRPKLLLRYLSKIRSFNAVKNIFRGFAGFFRIIFS